MELQLKSFKPPHPIGSMVSESELRQVDPPTQGKEVAMAADD